MLTLITGGSKSGKSSIGETLALGEAGERYYIATMEPFGREARETVERHRRQREGKGFVTVEQYVDIAAAPISEGCTALVECVGNLCANEMFSAKAYDPVEKIVGGIALLNERASRLIVVTNQVGCDSFGYPPQTEEYIRVMGETNRRLAQAADLVIEAVYGLPLVLKGELPKCL